LGGKNPDKVKINDEKTYSRTKERKAQKRKEWCFENYTHYMWRSVKNRAKMLSIEFTLSPEDITIPEKCPILGIPLEKGIFKGAKQRYNCPSVDRINPKKGYTKDNIQIISFQANRWKSDMSLDDIKKIMYYMENHHSM